MNEKWRRILTYGSIAVLAAYSAVAPLAAREFSSAAIPSVVFIVSAWLWADSVTEAD